MSETANCAINGCMRPIKARQWCSAHYQRWRNHGDPLAGGTPTGDPMRWIMAHLEHDGDECLIWPYSKSTHGYAQVWFNGRLVSVSRFVCGYRNGPPPSPNHDAAHSCGKGKSGCVHPKHIRWATGLENEADKDIHGTRPRGEKHYLTRLTAAQVSEIRASSSKNVEIARRFGLHPSTVRHIKKRISWSWL